MNIHMSIHFCESSTVILSLLPIIHFSMKKRVFFLSLLYSFHQTLYFLFNDPDMNLDRQQDQNLWEQINGANKKINGGRDISENWTFFILYSFVSGISGKQKGLYHFMVDSELLGRAGFEPAQTYCQRIYSPSPLTARASTQEESILGLLIIHDQLTSFRSTLPPGEVESPLPP